MYNSVEAKYIIGSTSFNYNSFDFIINILIFVTGYKLLDFLLYSNVLGQFCSNDGAGKRRNFTAFSKPILQSRPRIGLSVFGCDTVIHEICGNRAAHTDIDFIQ